MKPKRVSEFLTEDASGQTGLRPLAPDVLHGPQESGGVWSEGGTCDHVPESTGG